MHFKLVQWYATDGPVDVQFSLESNTDKKLLDNDKWLKKYCASSHIFDLEDPMIQWLRTFHTYNVYNFYICSW